MRPVFHSPTIKVEELKEEAKKVADIQENDKPMLIHDLEYHNNFNHESRDNYDDPDLIKKIKDGMKQKMKEKYIKSVTQKDGDNCPRSPKTPAFHK